MRLQSTCVSLLLVIFHVDPSGASAATGGGSAVNRRPDVEILRAQDAKRLTANAVAEAVQACVTSADPVVCEGRLGVVLPVLSRDGEGGVGEVVRDGLRLAEKEWNRDGMATRLLNGVAEPGRQEAPAKTQQRLAIRQGADSEQRQLSASDISRLSGPEYDQRLLEYVDGLLPREAQERAMTGLRGYVASTCSDIFEGRSTGTCQEIGLTELRRASLWLGLMELLQSRAEPDVVARYIRLDRELVDRVWAKAQVASGSETLGRAVAMVRRWQETTPSRWSAWADLLSLE
jgi:hypothetical protein